MGARTDLKDQFLFFIGIYGICIDGICIDGTLQSNSKWFWFDLSKPGTIDGIGGIAIEGIDIHGVLFFDVITFSGYPIF